MNETPIAEAILSMMARKAEYEHAPPDAELEAFHRLHESKVDVETLIRKHAQEIAEEHAEVSDLAGPVPRSRVPSCPHKRVLELWAEVLPELPQHTEWTATRSKHLQARWKATAVAKKWQTEEDGLLYLRKFFLWIRRSRFLMGAASGLNRRSFQLELAWLILPENWAKVHEGKYHEEQ